MKVALYSQTEKREKMVLQAFNVAAKYGKAHFQRLIKSDLIGDGKKIDLVEDGHVEDQLIDCPYLKKEITRGECVDFSGEEKNPHCNECIIGIGNKKILFPPA
jgi:hypothetical protein